MLQHKVELHTTFLEEPKGGISDFFRNYSLGIHIGVLYHHQRNNSGNFSVTILERGDAHSILHT